MLGNEWACSKGGATGEGGRVVGVVTVDNEIGRATSSVSSVRRCFEAGAASLTWRVDDRGAGRFEC